MTYCANKELDSLTGIFLSHSMERNYYCKLLEVVNRVPNDVNFGVFKFNIK